MALKSKVTDKDKGTLTVMLTGCSNLEVRVLGFRVLGFRI